MPGCWSEPTTKDAYRLSCASLVITALAALAGIGLYLSIDSSLALVFGLENCIDFISSAIVLWRFFAPFALDEATEKKLKSREKRASMAISFTLILLGISIIGTAINDLKHGAGEPFDLAGALAISFFSIPVFLTLTCLKFRYADQLSSPSLYKDGICSLIGTVLATAMFVNSLLIANTSEAWWADPLIALVGGFCAIWIGAKAVIEAQFRDKIPVFSLKWWMLSKGDGDDEMSGRPVGPSDLELKVEDLDDDNNDNGTSTPQQTSSGDKGDDVEII